MLLGLRSFFSRGRASLLLVAAFVTACGGGVDSGGTGAPATSFASGPITGFGSVIVNGVHYDDRSATVSDADGNLRSRTDLRLGMTIEARGTAITVDADGNDASTATSIVFGSEIVGPVAANDLVARTLTVLGHAVDTSTTTVFDNALAGGQAALAPGDIVEVYASFDAATGRYAATRIERKTAVGAFVLRGIVSSFDATARTFALGATRISYAGLPAAGLAATLADGRFVRVSVGLVPGADGVFAAVRITDGSPAIGEREDVKIKGLVSAFTSATQFSVNGTPVDAHNAQFPDGMAGVALGTRVEVEGSTAAGVLLATRVEVVSDGEESGKQFEVQGTIESIDTAGKTYVMRDVIVDYSGSVDFRDGTVADLAAGRDVRARGTISADGTRLQAARIDFRH